MELTLSSEINMLRGTIDNFFRLWMYRDLLKYNL